MKIIYCIAGFYRRAGMERVLAVKANALASDGYDVVIVTTDQRNADRAFELNPSVKTIDLGINYEETNNGSFMNKVLKFPFKQMSHRMRLAKLLKKERADVVVSMFCNEERFLTRIKDGSKKVLEVHFSRYKRLQYGRKGLWALADKIRSRSDMVAARRFDKFVVLTQEDKGYWKGLDNIEVIPNPVNMKFETPAALESKTVTAIGRLCYQKGFERLVDVWKIVSASPKANGWKLNIYGDGEDRALLKESIKRNGLEDSCFLCGVSDNMKEIYSNTSVIAMTSRYEGLPMVLIEAQAAGVPTVSFDCKCGPRDIICDGVNGFLVKEGDVVGFANALLKLFSDPDLRHSMGKSSYERAVIWNEDLIMTKWKTLFAEL